MVLARRIWCGRILSAGQPGGFRAKLLLVSVRRAAQLALAAVVLTLIPFTSRAGDFVVFGPQQYVRNTGQPISVTNTFAALDPTTTFTMRIESTGVSSAIVTLNGVDVFSPNDFNANVHLLTKPVTLLANNQLTVELRGSPGESLTLRIIGRRVTA